MDSDIKVLIVSDIEYEKLIAEIYYREKFVALINQDQGIENLQMEFPNGELNEDMIIRKIDLKSFKYGIDLAMEKLVGKK
ncbi:hypothetical protein [Leptospira alexanderi]|uniref:hypothetical protein n=1 Tax=Leptospira alexanderi TaxID=100053 RepID=UPI00028A385A|nr:hypothetical protein [Leptospira alexanderi]